MSGVPEYVLERLIDAPGELIWRCWTDASLFCRWYGPGVQTIVHKMEVRVGGESLIEFKWEDHSLFQRFRYLEVQPHARLTWLCSATDATGEKIAPSVTQDWPAHFLMSITMEPSDASHLLHLSLMPVDAQEAEIIAFRKARLNIDEGWNAGMEVLNELLDALKKQ